VEFIDELFPYSRHAGMMAEIALGAWFGEHRPMGRYGVSAGDRCSGAENQPGAVRLRA
jgi:hypothetical protein